LHRRSGPSSVDVVAMAWMRRGKTHPNSFIASSGARSAFVASFTDNRPSRANERSKFFLKSLDLCGIAAIGESFNFRVMAFLSFDHGTSRANPCVTCSIVSAINAFAAAGSFADAWAPRTMASSSRSSDQSSPQSVGQPFSEYSWRSGAAGWSNAGPDGDIRLRCGDLPVGVCLLFVPGFGLGFGVGCFGAVLVVALLFMAVSALASVASNSAAALFSQLIWLGSISCR
jgi:hypothetical protein